MEETFTVRTDLAVELEEDIAEEEKPEGISVAERMVCDGRIKVTKVRIINENGKEYIGKDIGTYITLESDELAEPDEGYHREMSLQIARYVKKLLPDGKRRILIVGLGNREATPDSLGPRVIDNIKITRYTVEGSNYEVSGIIPGVMAQTGMESAEIIKGITEEIHPDVIIAIDSLAARNISRLNTTIQISDTGIMPGSGVGNHRKGITRDTVGVPVIAIGVPMVVDAVTIVNDTFANLLRELCNVKAMKDFKEVFDEFTPIEKYELIKEVIEPSMAYMYVTPKDVDATVKYLSYTISEGLNIIWSGGI